MIGTLVRLDDTDRLHALQCCKILDSGRETEFDRIVFTAAQLFGVPIAAVLLVDERRVWCKAQVGLTQREYPQLNAVCSEAVLLQTTLVVEDTAADPRFASAAMILQEGVRFYAGVAITGPGRMPLGTLCVMDRVPRQLDGRRRWLLSGLADEVTGLLLSRAATRDLMTGPSV